MPEVPPSLRVAVPRDHGISIDICEKVDKLTMIKAALCGGSAELGAKKRLEEAVHCYLDVGERAVGERKGGVCGWKMKNETKERSQEAFERVW